MTTTGTVVVGADGSPASRTAIEFALHDAARRGARVRVVAAAQPPEFAMGLYGMTAIPSPQTIAEHAHESVRQEVDGILRARPDLAAVPLTVEATVGAPGRVLVDAAEGADVLVLGHRGRGPVASAVLGSVGLHCILQATCPVTIVRPTEVGEAITVEPALATQGG
jgi:nucleotide-binding universal stress UspA family protein